MIDVDGDCDLEILALGVGEIGLIDFRGVAASPVPGTAPPTTLLATTPNPGSGPVTFLLQVSATSVVSVKVLDIAGRVVWASPPEQLAPGQRSILWPGTDRRGELVASGVYYYEVKQADRVLGTGKLVVRH